MHAVYKFLDGLNDRIGRCVAWLILFMVIVQFAVVLQRYVFSIGNLFMQESIVYMHGILIMLAAGYTFLHNGHVRVDIFYRDASQRVKDWTDMIGSLLFLLPVCYIVIWSAWGNVLLSWPQVHLVLGGMFLMGDPATLHPDQAHSLLGVLYITGGEGSNETSGIPVKYLLKSTILVFAVLLALQGVSTAIKAAMRLAGHKVDDRYCGEESLD